eukprot:s7380_g2.t1
MEQQQQPQQQPQQPNQQERFSMLMNNLGQATEAMARVATQSANQQAQLTAALQRLMEDPRQGTRAPVATPGPASVPFDTGGKILKPPEAFSPAAIEEEVSQWSDWAFTFKNFLAFMDVRKN